MFRRGISGRIGLTQLPAEIVSPLTIRMSWSKVKSTNRFYFVIPGRNVLNP